MVHTTVKIEDMGFNVKYVGSMISNYIKDSYVPLIY